LSSRKTIIAIFVCLLLTSSLSYVCVVKADRDKIVVKAIFQPVQVVWQSDPVYGEDIELLPAEPNVEWNAKLPMVLGKNTFLFGWPYSDRYIIRVEVANYYLQPKQVRIQFLVDETEIYLSGVYTVPTGSPPRPGEMQYVPGILKVNITAPIPSNPFQFATTGAHAIRVRTTVTPSSNEAVCRLTVVETRNLRLYYVGLRFPGDPNPNLTPDYARAATDLILGTYPLAEDRIERNTRYVTVTVASITWNNTQYQIAGLDLEDEDTGRIVRDYVRNYLARFGWLAGTVSTPYWDRVVAIVPRGWSHHFDDEWFGLAILCGSSPTVFVEENRIPTVAHEVGHTYSLGDEYPANPQALGYWVNNRADRNLTCIMGNAAERWIDKPDYRRLLERFRMLGGSEILGVSGYIFRNGSVILEPWYRFSGGMADFVPDSIGNYSVVLLDREARVLSRIGFNMSFQESVDYVSLVTVDFAPFAFRVPFVPETRLIQIRNATDHVLVSRSVTQGFPAVRIVSPTEDEALMPAGNYTVRWDASDADGDVLTYSMFLSSDLGQTWLPLVLDIRTKDYALNLTDLEPGQRYLVGVLASDGVNMGWNVSGTFRIRTLEESVSELLEICQRLEEEYEGLSLKYGQLELSQDELTSRLSILESNNQELRDDYDSLSMSYAELSSRYNDLKQNYEDLQSSHSLLIGELRFTRDLSYVLMAVATISAAVMVWREWTLRKLRAKAEPKSVVQSETTTNSEKTST